MSGYSSKLIAFNYFGGKFTFLDELYALFPSNINHLVDLFGGSFSVSLNYKGNLIKTANEVNGQITNFFEVLRDNPEELIAKLELTPCSMLEFNNSWEMTGDNIEDARRFYVRVRQSFFGLGAQRQNKGWHMALTKSNVNGGETVSKWNNAIKKLIPVAQSIRENFQITNFSFETAIEKLDSEGTFFYCDPPYPLSVRASRNDYKHEFTDDQHIELARLLNGIKGMAMVSSYEGDLYNELYKDWNKHLLKPRRNNIRSGRVQEVVWVNYKTKSSLFN